MAINEDQLATWSHQGSIQQSAATYQTIRNVLNSTDTPFYSKSFENFLQGSYGNDTNVWRDSDVDIVMRLTSIYYVDLNGLTATDKANYERLRSPTDYSLDRFKQEVAKWLTTNFGDGVDATGKAIFVPGNGNRRDADVLTCAEHREFITYPATGSPTYREGIIFWKTDGTRIINYPKQHSANCTAKHQNTNSYFKPTVRIFKNIRNRMLEDGRLEDGVAPSYFLEGLLYNVPAKLFGTSYQDTIVNCFNHCNEADTTQFTCANGIHWLLRDGHPVCWPPQNFRTFMQAFRKFWNEY